MYSLSSLRFVMNIADAQAKWLISIKRIKSLSILYAKTLHFMNGDGLCRV